MLVEATAQPVRPWAAFSLAAVAQLMIVLDISIINVALPSIQRGLQFSQEDLQWVVNIYVLIFGGFLLLGGRAGDLLGHRRLFMGGMALFSLASLAGGLAQNPGWLIAARGVQGLGGAIISPVALSIVTSSFAEGAARNRAVGIYGALAGVGGAAGVLLGGILTDNFGWQWVLFVNVPIGVAVILLSPLFIPSTRGTAHGGSFDLPGAVSVTAGLCLLVYGVVKAPDNGWGSSHTIGFFAAAAVLLAAFMAIEWRSAEPLVRLGIFRNQGLAVANVLGFLTGLVIFGMFFFLSLYEQYVLGYSPLKTGLSYLPLAFAIIVAAGVASALVTRFGFKYIIAIGMGLSAVGLILFVLLPASGSYAANLLPGMLIVAVGLGFIFVPLQIAAVGGVGREEIGLASGLINASQQVGGAIGLAVLSTISTTRFNTVIAAEHIKVSQVMTLQQQIASAPARVDGYHYAFAASAIVLVIGVILIFVLLPDNPAPAAEPALAGARA
jgi:EmrB/QacA subfamily drug resistance transporter